MSARHLSAVTRRGRCLHTTPSRPDTSVRLTQLACAREGVRSRRVRGLTPAMSRTDTRITLARCRFRRSSCTSTSRARCGRRRCSRSRGATTTRCPATTVEELARALRVPRLRALHRGLDPDDERAADARRLPRRSSSTTPPRRPRTAPSTSKGIFSPAERVRRGVDWDEVFTRLLRRRATRRASGRRRGAPDARHPARLPARGGAPRRCATRRGTATAASSASGSAGSRRSSRRSRTRRRSRSRRDDGPGLGAARGRGRRRRRPSAARSTRSAPTGSATASARSRTRRSCASSPTAASCSTSARSRTCARARSRRSPSTRCRSCSPPACRCSISTDDPAMFDTDLDAGLRGRALARRRAARVLRGGRRGALCDEATKSRLRGIGEAIDWARDYGYSRDDENGGRAWHGLIVAGTMREARRVERRPRAAGGGSRSSKTRCSSRKLRAHAKWVFVLLAVIFAGSFVFLGVGSGSSGLGDLLQGNWGDLFGSSSGNSAQVEKDQKRIEQEPEGLRGVQGHGRARRRRTERSTRRSPRC